MAETLVQFQTPVIGRDGTAYVARACGSPAADGLWHGWIEFSPADGGEPVRSGRETTQPNRRDAIYWATGLSAVYLEGALQRALEGPTVRPVAIIGVPEFDAPAASSVPAAPAGEPTRRAVLDPFSVFQKGEALLRKQLGALSQWHLVNIVLDYELSSESETQLTQLSHRALVERIVEGVRLAAADAGEPVPPRARSRGDVTP